MLRVYESHMKGQIEEFFRRCFDFLGWEYQPDGRHSDILNIEDIYVKHGQFWCLYENGMLAGTVAVRCINEKNNICEMKRLYVLPEYQGKGYGGYLFKTALNYAKQEGFSLIRLDTRNDRTAACHLIEKYNFKAIDQYNENMFAEMYFELDLNDYEPEE